MIVVVNVSKSWKTADLITFTINIRDRKLHFHTTGLFPKSLKTSENQFFLIISGGVERDQWNERG